MKLYQVEVAKPARKELAKLSKEMQKKIVEALECLVTTPRPQGAEKLQSNPTFLRIRCGDYRIIYAVDDKACLCVVVVIRDRKDAFKGVKALDAKLAKAIAAVSDRLIENVGFQA